MSRPAQARLWFSPGELNEIWASMLLGASASGPIDGFTAKSLVDFHGKAARYGRAKPLAGGSGEGYEVPTYPGERRLMALLTAGEPGPEADTWLVGSLRANPDLLALDPDLEGAIRRRGRGKRQVSKEEK